MAKMVPEFTDQVREDVVNKARPPYKNKCVEKLADQTRLYDEKHDKKIDKEFTLWLKNNIYEKLIDIELAETFMKFVLCSERSFLIFMPTLQDSEGPEQQIVLGDYGMEGVTFAPYEQIFIAAKRNKEEWDKIYQNYFSSLIVHELAHFAFYETFCNDYNPFPSQDEEQMEIWGDIMDDLMGLQLEIKEIKDAFKYRDSKVPQELVVRYFQCLMLYHHDKVETKNFKDTYPELTKASEDALETLKSQYDIVCAVREINQIAVDSENSPYQKQAIENGKLQLISEKTQIVQTNNSTLAANFIFHEFKKEDYFQSKFVFLNAKDLKENSVMLAQFKLASARQQVKITFVINCDQVKDFEEINSELNDLIKKLVSDHLVILVCENQSFKFSYIDTKTEVLITPDNLTDDFIEKIKINFQGRDDLFITSLISLYEFRSLSVIPSGKIHKNRIPIGNQLELELCKHYVPRTFSIRNEDDWYDFDDVDNIFKSNTRIMVTNGPGAGKSVESIHMLDRLQKLNSYKTNEPTGWIVHLNLSDLYEILSDDKKFLQYDLQTIFYNQILKFNQFEVELFHLMVKADRVIFIFDSLDEIAPKFIKQIRNLIEMIFSFNERQRIIIFTRPHIAKRMDEFEFEIFKLKDIVEKSQKQLILKILQSKYPDMPCDVHEEKVGRIESFLERKNFKTPLMIKIVTEVSSYPSFDSDETTMFDIYETFVYELMEATNAKKSDYVKDYKLKILRDINRYFAKHALENLIDNQDFYGVSTIIKTELNEFITYYFRRVKTPKSDDLQRMGVINIDSENKYKFIHASFKDFYIAKFIKENIHSFDGRNRQICLMEFFSMLLSEDRFQSVIEFLKCFDEEIADFLDEFEVIVQTLTRIDDSVDSECVNVMPIIDFFVDVVSTHSNLNRVCIDKKIYPSTIQFSDPLKILNKICSSKLYSRSESLHAWEEYVNENLLMNKTNCYVSPEKVKQRQIMRKDDSQETESKNSSNNSNRIGNKSINIIDVLACCGKKDYELKFLVTKKTFREYFESMTSERFNELQIRTMLGHLLEPEPNYDRSFFLMAKNPNMNVINVFMDFYDKNLLHSDYFKDFLLCSFLPVLIFHKEKLNAEKSMQLIERLATLNAKTSVELFCPKVSEIKHNWLIIMSENIDGCHNVTYENQLEITMDFLISTIGSKTTFSKLCVEKSRKYENFLFSLLHSASPSQFEIALKKVFTYVDSEAMKNILMDKNSMNMTILQMIFSKINSSAHQRELILSVHKEVFGEVCVNIVHSMLLESVFYNQLLSQISELEVLDIEEKMCQSIQVIISTILSILNNLSNSNNQKQFLLSQDSDGNTILTSMMGFINEDMLHRLISLCLDFLMKNTITLFIIRNNSDKSFLSSLNYKSNCCEIKDSIKKAFEIDFDTRVVEAFYELFSNENLDEDQFDELLTEIHSKFDLKSDDINLIFNYECSEDKFTILTAAARCKKEGRVNAFLKLFKEHLVLKSYKNSLLVNDLKVCSMSWLLSNEYQDCMFAALFEIIEELSAYDQVEIQRIARHLIFSSHKHKTNILFVILYSNQKGIQREIALKLLSYLESHEKRTLTFLNPPDYFDTKKGNTLISSYIHKLLTVPLSIIETILTTCFENNRVFQKVLLKTRHLDEEIKELVSSNQLVSAFQFFNYQGKAKLTTLVKEFFEKCMAFDEGERDFLRFELQKRNFYYFRDSRTIETLIKSIEEHIEYQRDWRNDEKFLDDLKNFLMTLIHILADKDCQNILNKTRFKNFICMSLEEMFSFVESVLEFDDLREVLNFETDNNSSLQMCFRNGSLELQQDYLRCLSKIFKNKLEYQNYLEQNLCTLDHNDNIFHALLKRKNVNFIALRATYDLIMRQFEDLQKVKHIFLFQQNENFETPLICGIKSNLNVKKCLNFFSSVLNGAEMRDLIKISGRVYSRSDIKFNAVGQILVRVENDEYFFQEAIELADKYIDKSEESEFWHGTLSARDNYSRSLMRTLLLSSHNLVKNPDFKRLLKKMQYLDMEKELIQIQSNRLEINFESLSYIEHLELMEETFDEDKVRSILRETHDYNQRSFLYFSLAIGTSDSPNVAIEFHQRYFTEPEFMKMITDVFKHIDFEDNNILHAVIISQKFDDGSFYSVCSIMKKYIKELSIIERLFFQKNRDGKTPVFLIADHHNVTECLETLSNEFLDSVTIINILLMKNEEKLSILNIESAKGSQERDKIRKFYLWKMEDWSKDDLDIFETGETLEGGLLDKPVTIYQEDEYNSDEYDKF